jgi:hypothetical protein
MSEKIGLILILSLSNFYLINLDIIALNGMFNLNYLNILYI